MNIYEALVADMEFLSGYGFKPCAQIFVTGPQNYNVIVSDEDITRIHTWVIANRVELTIHGAYVDHPWGRTPLSIHNIKVEMEIAARLHATGVIVHLGKSATENLDHVLDRVTDFKPDVLRRVLQTGVTLWLEINAAKPTENTFETPKKISALFDKVAKCRTRGVPVGLCVDTAHLYSCGVALTTREEALRWLNKLPDVPIMMHLNDSSAVLGSGIDRHAAIFEGNIWRAFHPTTGMLPPGESGAAAIMEWAAENSITTILERDSEGLTSDLTLISQMGYF